MLTGSNRLTQYYEKALKGGIIMLMNSKRMTQLHYLMFKEGREKNYTGICYELSIIMTGEDPEQLKKDLEQSAYNYVTTICGNDLSNTLLNQQHKLPKKYSDLFFGFAKAYEIDNKNQKQLNSNVKDTRAFLTPTFA